ncbi:hypothetical protein EDC01DRAFT_789808 [Geopyxis carbonaria]|nr:hypothetical protein EDC01DRAFT_789808 [Geopyxis carbonaria]
MATPSPVPGSMPQKLPPQTIKIKRPRDEEPVASLFLDHLDSDSDRTKRAKRNPRASPKFYFRHVGTTESPQFGQRPPKLREPASPAATTSAAPKRQTTFGEKDAALPGAPQPGPKREPKRFTLKRTHPYASAAAAVFQRMADKKPPPAPDAAATTPVDEEMPAAPVEPRKKPRTHPKEREAQRATRAERREAEDAEREQDAEIMMLQYLELDPHNALSALPATPAAGVGGGVGGGNWSHPAAMVEDEEEGDWVYDVYMREEHTGVVEGEDYGVLVFEGADDEEWWYEGANAEEDSDVEDGDDEDSNAEDFFTNDYPDEPESEEDSEDEGMQWSRMTKPAWKRGGAIKGSDDEEEYDLDLDSSEDDEPTASRLERDVWGLRRGDI